MTGCFCIYDPMHGSNTKYEPHTIIFLCFIPFVILGFKLVYFEAFIIDVRVFIILWIKQFHLENLQFFLDFINKLLYHSNMY
jgi:hypothetical protein